MDLISLMMFIGGVILAGIGLAIYLAVKFLPILIPKVVAAISSVVVTLGVPLTLGIIGGVIGAIFAAVCVGAAITTAYNSEGFLSALNKLINPVHHLSNGFSLLNVTKAVVGIIGSPFLLVGCALGRVAKITKDFVSYAGGSSEQTTAQSPRVEREGEEEHIRSNSSLHKLGGRRADQSTIREPSDTEEEVSVVDSDPDFNTDRSSAQNIDSNKDKVEEEEVVTYSPPR